MRRFAKYGAIVALITITTIGIGILAFYFVYRAPIDVREFVQIQVEKNYADRAFFEALGNGVSSSETKRDATTAHQARMEALAKRCLPLANKYPDSPGGIAALVWSAAEAPVPDTRSKAYTLLAARLPDFGLTQLKQGWGLAEINNPKWIKKIAPELLERIVKNIDQPEAAYLLAQVCVVSSAGAGDDAEPPKVFSEAAGLISKHSTGSPDIARFCQTLGVFPRTSPRWAVRFEPELQAILDTNKHRFVRCCASMALAVVAGSDPNRREEAKARCEEFVKEFNGQTDYLYQDLEREYCAFAKERLTQEYGGVSMAKAPR